MVKLSHQDIVERIVKKKQDDPRRDKRKCIYYNKGACEEKMMKCYGSSYCRYYKEDNIIIREYKCNLQNYIQDDFYQLSKKTTDKIVIKKGKKITIIEPKITKIKKGHIVIETTNKVYEQLYNKCLNEDVVYINLFLRNALSFDKYDKYKFISFFIQTEDNLFQCGTRESNVIMVKYDDVIRIQIPVLRFHLKEVPVYNGKFLWKQRDSNFGTIIFKSNKSK